MNDDLAAIRDDLVRVDSNLRWAINMAWPTSRPLDAPAGRALPPRDPDTDPDQVPGPRFDLGLGDHRARTAVRDATIRLAAAESNLYQAACTALGVPSFTLVGAHLDIDHRRQFRLITSVRRLTRHLEHLQAVDRKAIGGARYEVDMAYRALESALTRGEAPPETHAVADRDRCKICRRRPKAKKKGGRCDACHQWKTRNGYERPAKLDAALDAPYDAQRRRQARGEGWGDESLSCTWTPL